MIYEEKQCLIDYMFNIKKLTSWNIYLLRYLREFLKDSELINERERLLDLTYNIVTNKSILQYVKITSPLFINDKFIDIINELINIYLMSIEDIRGNIIR